MLYPKIKEKKNKIKLSISNEIYKIKNNVFNFIRNFRGIDYFLLFLSKCFHF